MPDSARAESGARADWQACTTHAFPLDHRTSCTVFRVIVVFAMTIMARSFTTHLTSLVWSIGFGSDRTHGSPVRTRAPDSPNLSNTSNSRAQECEADPTRAPQPAHDCRVMHGPGSCQAQRDALKVIKAAGPKPPAAENTSGVNVDISTSRTLCPAPVDTAFRLLLSSIH